jgi:hypothetical protein
MTFRISSKVLHFRNISVTQTFDNKRQHYDYLLVEQTKSYYKELELSTESAEQKVIAALRKEVHVTDGLSVNTELICLWNQRWILATTATILGFPKIKNTTASTENQVAILPHHC